jgi:hypothetical protein
MPDKEELKALKKLAKAEVKAGKKGTPPTSEAATVQPVSPPVFIDVEEKILAERSADAA